MGEEPHGPSCSAAAKALGIIPRGPQSLHNGARDRAAALPNAFERTESCAGPSALAVRPGPKGTAGMGGQQHGGALPERDLWLSLGPYKLRLLDPGSHLATCQPHKQLPQLEREEAGGRAAAEPSAGTGGGPRSGPGMRRRLFIGRD